MSMDMTPFREYAARLRKLAATVEDDTSTIGELAHAAHACGLELRMEFGDAGRAVPMPVAAEGKAR
jgi:hypothetical protein